MVEIFETLRVKKRMNRQGNATPGERLDELLESKSCRCGFDRI